MAIDLSIKYLPYVDEIFTTESKKSLLTNQDFSWEGAHSVKIYNVTTAQMNDYNRNGKNTTGSRYGSIEALSATTEEYILKKDRSFTFEIDKLDENETAGQLQASSALARQTRQVVIPEVDTYVYSVMCKNAGTKAEAIALTENNIYEEIIKANAILDDNEVPETGRVLIVTPNTYLLMKKSKDIILESELGEDMKLKGVISNLDGCAVVKVPSNRLSDDFGFMIAHPVATVAPTKLEDYTIHENPLGYSGAVVEGRICYDAFVLKNKAKAIYYQPITTE